MKQKKQKVEPIIWIILIIGAILGFILWWSIQRERSNIFDNILFCIGAVGFGSITALFVAYFATSAIVEIQDFITRRKK